jgi:hypothetical protein
MRVSARQLICIQGLLGQIWTEHKSTQTGVRGQYFVLVTITVSNYSVEDQCYFLDAKLTMRILSSFVSSGIDWPLAFY